MQPHSDRFKLPAESHPDTRAIHQYWLIKANGRPMPRRADIDPAEIPPRLLPFLSIVEVVPDDRRYIYRLIGTAEVQVRGFDPTGKSVHEGFMGPNAEAALAHYDRVVRTAIPFLFPIPDQYEPETARYRTQEIIFLPLSEDGAKVDKIVVFAACIDLYNPGQRVQLAL
jgi:hypothetical protein